MPARAVLFDLDGTLADTLEDIAGAMNRALLAHGFPARTLDEYRQMIGDGAAVLAARAAPAGADHASVLARFRVEYAGALIVATRAYHGIDAVLDACVTRGYGIAVLSNKPDGPAQAIVRALFPGRPWLAVRGEVAGTPRKPDPTAAREIAALAPGAEWLFVGDTKTDMLTAAAAGMVAIGAAWGFRPRRELQDHGARVVCDTPRDLLAYLTAC